MTESKGNPRPKAGKRYETPEEMRAGVLEELKPWFKETFKRPWDEAWKERFGPGQDTTPDAWAAAANKLDAEARAKYDAIAIAAREASEWLARNQPKTSDLEIPSPTSLLVQTMRREVPKLGVWSERAWLAVEARRPGATIMAKEDRAAMVSTSHNWRRLRPSDSFPRVLHGLERFVHAWDAVNLLQLPARPRGESQFLSDTELAKISLLCGFFPDIQRTWLTVGAAVDRQMHTVKKIRARVGALTTPEMKSAIGLAGKRGPKRK